jgi:ABC-type uncharacterized transport system permease subunit
MSLFWLRVTLALYSLGLLHALITIVSRRTKTFPFALGAISLGAVFHFVSLVEDGLSAGRLPISTFQQAVSTSALLLVAVFLLAYWRYRFEALCVFVFPLAFMLTLAAAISPEAPATEGPLLRSGWLYLHAGMFFLGHALLFVTFAAGLMYLLQERELKSKKPRAFYYRLPPLESLDDLARKTLAIGFTLVTVGIIIGAAFASAKMGRDWPLDHKVAWSFVAWFIYLGLIVSRWTAGWRGRKAAYFAIAGFCAVVLTWGTSSGIHSFMSR